MAVLVDVICSKCMERQYDKWSTMLETRHKNAKGCRGRWERYWTVGRAPNPGTHPAEKVVVYQSAKEGGKIQYPGRNDVPVPDRLRQRGYERVELNVQDLASFEKRHNVMNERRHYDRNGRGLGETS